MKRFTSHLCTLLMLSPLLFAAGGAGPADTSPIPVTGGDEIPEQVFLPIPPEVDAERIAIDPASGQKLYLGMFEGVVGRPLMIRGRAVDPDQGDLVQASIATPQFPGGTGLALDAEGYYEIAVDVATSGYNYCDVWATDGIAVRRGTWVIRGRMNHPPVLCGGRP